MTLTLEVPTEVAEKLERDAAASGTSVAEYALQLLGVRTKRPFRSPAELMDHWQAEGLIGSDTETEDSSVVARRLREQAERRG